MSQSQPPALDPDHLDTDQEDRPKTLPLDLESDNPAVVYLESLSRGSYWAVRHSLETIAEILAGEDADPWTFPWEELRYQHTARVRRELVQRYAPATVNKVLSALPTTAPSRCGPGRGGGIGRCTSLSRCAST